MDDTNNPQQQDLLNDPAVTAASEKNDAIVLLNLEDMIRSHLDTIEKLDAQIREQREMLDNVLLNDSTYREHTELAKEANKVKSATRSEIMKQPSVVQVANKVKEAKMELHELQSTLSEYLSEYQRLAKTNIIERADGSEFEIVNTCKLIKRSSKK
jgi:hypothetical protein